MDPGLWRVIERVRDGAHGAEEEFVEWTRPFLAEGQNERALPQLYRHVGQYLVALRKKDDFQAWFAEQQSLIKEEPSANAKPEHLAEMVKVGAQNKVVAASIRRRFARLVLNAWLPLFLICFCLSIWSWHSAFEPWSPESEKLALALLAFSLLTPTLLSFLVSPLLNTWRSWIRKDQVGILKASLLFTMIALPLLAVLTKVWIFFPEIWVSLDENVASYGLAYLLILPAAAADSVWRDSSSLLIPTLASLMMIWLTFVAAQLHRWVPVAESKPVRKVVVWLFLGSVVLAGLVGTLSLSWQSRPEPELVTLVESVPKTHDQWDDSLSLAFEKDARVLSYVPPWSMSDPSDNKDICVAWLETGRELWAKEGWWKDARYESLAKSADDTGWLGSEQGPASYSELEARIRLSLSQRYISPQADAATRMVKARLSQQQWTQLQELAQATLRAYRAEQNENLERAISSYFRGRLNTSPGSIRERTECIDVNSEWRRYVQVQDSLRQVDPLSSSDIEDSLLQCTPAIYKMNMDKTGHQLARTVLATEVKRLQSLGQELPAELDGFRKDISKPLSPYQERLRYRKDGGEAIIELLHLRNLEVTYSLRL